MGWMHRSGASLAAVASRRARLYRAPDSAPEQAVEQAAALRRRADEQAQLELRVVAAGLDLERAPEDLARVLEVARGLEDAPEEEQRLLALGRELDPLRDVLERLASDELVARVGEVQRIAEVGAVLACLGIEVGGHAEGLRRLD